MGIAFGCCREVASAEPKLKSNAFAEGCGVRARHCEGRPLLRIDSRKSRLSGFCGSMRRAGTLHNTGGFPVKRRSLKSLTLGPLAIFLRWRPHLAVRFNGLKELGSCR